MNKEQLLIELMIVIAAMQNTAVDLVEQKSYNTFDAFMDDILEVMSGEEIEIKVQNNVRVFGIVDRERTMQEIGENQALMIFGEENEE